MFKKFFAVFFLAAALVVVGSSVNQASATTVDEFDAVVDSNIDFLALRSGPSVNYSMIARIPPGAHVVVTFPGIDSYRQLGYTDYNDDFLIVTYRGMKGFAHGRYITRLRHLRGRS